MSYLLDLAASLNAEIETTLDHIRRDALIERLGEVQQALASGGGGGGGSSSASAANQVAGNNLLSTIDSNVAQSLINLFDILTELKDDTFVSESVWFDRKDVLNFYIRRLTFDQDTQTPVLAWYDKDGNGVSPDVSLLIQGNATSELQQETINQIVNINSIAQQIQTNQQNQLVSQITQAQVVAAIQSAADIDTIIARLASIDTKTTIPNIRALTTATDSVAVGSLPGTIAADIAAIKTNTAKISQFSFQLAEDSAGTVFLIKTDNALGTSTNINVATGLPFTPVGSIELTDPIATQVTIEQNEYDCITASAGNWVVGDIVERIRTINTATGAVINTFWYKADGSVLATIPVIGTDVVDSDRQSLTVIRSIDAKTPTIGQKTSALSSPVVLASDQSDINPNRTLPTAGNQKITDGINTVAVKPASVAAVATDPALVVTLREPITSNGLTDTQLRAAPVPISGSVNQTPATAGFTKIVDSGGITTTTVRAANSQPILSDTALVVSISGNSSNYAPLTASAVATRHAIVGGVALPLNALPGLTGAQQYPMRLTPNGALMVQVDPNTTTSTRFGQSNPLADTSLSTASKIRSLVFTNESSVVLYLQIHQSNTALVSGTSAPFNGWIYRVPVNSTLVVGVSDFGDQGTALPFLGTPRLAISATRTLFTTPLAAQLLNCTLSYEVI
jgi:hypothetical protein